MKKYLFTILLLLMCQSYGYAEKPLAVRGSEGAISSSESLSLQNTIDAIGQLEADSDPKCLATANRVEDYLYGTPLADEARYQKIDLQKEMIESIWQEASKASPDRNELDLESLAGTLKRQLEYQFIDNDVLVHHPQIGNTELKRNHYDHYASIAYSLRAILAFKQDLVLKGFDGFLPMSLEAEEKLREFLDVASVVVLNAADKEARKENLRTITPIIYEQTWRKYFPEQKKLIRGVVAPIGELDKFVALRSIIREKILAYKKYNAIGDSLSIEGEVEEIFYEFAAKSFVKGPLPPREGSEWSQLKKSYQSMWESFTVELWRLATLFAKKDQSSLIRMQHVYRALHEITPHQVNQYEDVTFFVSTDEPTVLYGYDLDSFRDFSIHWKILRKSIEVVPGDFLDVDPFAAEVFAEGIAQYAVLLMRLSGDFAKADQDSRVSIAHVQEAATRVKRMSKMDQMIGDKVPAEAGKLLSAKKAIPSTRSQPSFKAKRPQGFSFEHQTAPWLIKLRADHYHGFVDFSGGGIAAEDVNGDEFPDLLLVSGGGNQLFINNQKGGFEDKSWESGLRREEDSPGEPRQPLFADLDNDGDQDLFITYVREPHRLYENIGGGQFREITSTTPLGGLHHVGGPATIFDYDRDGLLDIYIGYFGDYIHGVYPRIKRNNRNASRNRLFRNESGWQFKDVTRKSKTGHRGWAQAAVHSDLNQDGWQDLIIANDYGHNVYYLNQRDGTFVDVAEDYRLNEFGHSMNVGVSDLNRDGFPDYFISNIGILVKDNKYTLPYEDTDVLFEPKAMANVHIMESNYLHISKATDRDGLSGYVGSKSIQRGAIYSGWAWDADFFDYDNDGDDDLYLVNGATKFTKDLKPNKQDLRIYPVNYGENRNVLYENAEGELHNVTQGSGAGIMTTSRSAVYLDYDQDGDLDIVMNNYESPAAFLENQSQGNGNRWAKIRLTGNPSKGSSRDAIGAVLNVQTTEGNKLWREVRTATGYLSMHPKTQHLGLGDAEEYDLQIVWPNGQVQRVEKLSANQKYHFVQE